MACYLVTEKDIEIAKYSSVLNERDVARLRGMYEEVKGKPFDINDPAKAAKILQGLRRELIVKSITTNTTNMVSAFKSLRSAIPAEKRHNRVRMLTTMFSSELDIIQNSPEGRGLSRQQIANGVEDNDGITHYGQDYIFNQIYTRLRGVYSQYKKAGQNVKAEEISKVLDNFGAFCAYTKVALRDTEGLILGSNIQFAAETTPDNFEENDLSAWFDPSENTKESWQEASDMISSFSSLGRAVRRILSTLKQTDSNGRVILDDLDCPTYINPVTAHQALLESLGRFETEEEMMRAIEESGLSFSNQLKEVLTGSVSNKRGWQLRTEFCLDLYKNFQLYGDMVQETKSNGSIGIKTRTLNKVKNLLAGSYNYRLLAGVQLSETDSVYNTDGSINWANVQSLRKFIRENFIPKAPTEKDSVFVQASYQRGENTPFHQASPEKRATMLMRVANAIGIDLDAPTAKSLAMSKDLFSTKKDGLVRNIRGLIESIDGTATGIDAILKDDIKHLEAGEYDKIARKEDSFRKLLKAKTAKQSQLSSKGEGNIQEVVNRLLKTIATKRESFRVESRCTIRDKKGKTKVLYSHVTPSYMGTFIERINSFAKRKDKEGLKRYIESKFLDSSMFRTPDGRILNRWLADLYSDSFNDESLAETMTYHRFLGSPDLEFEDYTSKQHVTAMLNEFFFADNLTYTDYKQDNQGNYIDREGKVIPYGKDNANFTKLAVKEKRKYANYPVFILGDSGVSKYIRARQYSAQDIINGMYDIYLSECQRNLLVTAANNKLRSGGYKTIDNIQENTFKMLPFLEDKKYRPQGDPATWAEKDVKSAIRQYMTDATAEYKNKIKQLGILDTISSEKDGKKQVVYKYLDGILKDFTPGRSTEEALDRMIATFFWNTKFATLQQFQLMTIDVAFYKDTKDLQKRYKEIHAPGRPASIQARDHYGNLYSEDGIETCVYFDDRKINAEDSNPTFMGALLYQYATPEHRNEVDQAIKDGIITPKPSESKEENARQERLKEILGANYGTYSSYCSNALADGQGYRTLRSYRKVMGMLGKWTEAMERAYIRIQEVEATYGQDEDIPTEIIDEIAQLAVTFQPIKPYMFTIEKYKMNDEGGTLNIPVQHKYAEAVLIPVLLPKGSMAKHIALWMDNHTAVDPQTGEVVPQPIDVIGAWSTGGDKIVKVGGFGSTSLKGVSSKEDLEAAMNKGYVHKLSYADYREQTNVPEHINSARLFGTQLRKLIMSQIDMNKDYSSYIGGQKINIMGQETTLNGCNLINFYNSLIVANILDSYDELAKEVSDPKKLAHILQQAIINNPRQSLDLLYALSLNNDNSFAMALFEGGMEHDTSAMLLSIFKNRVNKQLMQGGAAVQVSALGIKGYEESGDLRYVTSKDGKNIEYAEVEVPWDLTVNIWDERKKKYVPTALKYSDYCNSDGTLIKDDNGNTLIEKRFPGILDRVCYRIPTERDYSMLRVKIVRFSPKIAGGTIKVPAQGTTQAGFDFDIDKLYYHMREYYCKPNEFADKLGKALASQLKTAEIGEALLSVIDDPLEYDYSKSCLEQHEDPVVARAIRNNMLLTLMEKRLEDPETFIQRTQPGGFADHSFAARQMRELLYSNEEDITGGTQSGVKVEYWNGFWTREQVAAQTDKIFLFGDNTDDRVHTHYVPSSTQAVIRGLLNAIGIDTKKNRGTSENSYFTDDDFDQFKAQVDEAIQQAINSGKTIVLPADGIGTGKAQLKERAPKCFAYLQEQLNNLRKSVNVGNGHVNFDMIEARAKEKSLDPEPNYDPSDPYTIIIYNQMNQVAGKLIGIFANQNTNHAFASLMKEFKLKKPLSFCGHSYQDFLHAPEGTDPALNIAECLSASVDAVKDPVLNYLNFNTITADAAGMLARLGYTGFEIGLLFNQSCIKEACDIAFNENVSIDIAIRKVEEKYTRIIQEKGAVSEGGQSALEKQSLANMIVTARKYADNPSAVSGLFASKQLEVLSFFTEVISTAAEVSDFITSTKFTASNSVGSTFGDMYAQQIKVRNYIKSFSNPKRKITMKVTDNIFTPISRGLHTMGKEAYMMKLLRNGGGNPFAYEQAMYDMNVRFIKSMSQYFPYESPNYTKARETATMISKTQSLDAATINELHNEMLSYILALQDGDFNGDNAHLDVNSPNNTGISNRDYYLYEFPKRIAKLLESDPYFKNNYAIFRYMLPEITEEIVRGEVVEHVGLILQDVGGLSSVQKEEIKESWADLIEHNREENESIGPLARDLFLYCYYRNGFDFSYKSFMHLTPVAVKERIIVDREGHTYKQLLDRILGVKGTVPILVNTENFLKSFIMNHTDNYRFTYKVRTGDAATETDATLRKLSGGSIAKSLFTVTVDDLGGSTQLFINTDAIEEMAEGSLMWIPALMINGNLYIASNVGTGFFNVSDAVNNSMTYRLIGSVKDNKVTPISLGTSKSEQLPTQAPFENGERAVDYAEVVPPPAPASNKMSEVQIKAIAKAVVQRMVAKGEVMAESALDVKNNLEQMLSSASLEDLQQFIQDAKTNYGKLLDDNGNEIC